MRWACHIFCGIAALVTVILGFEMFDRSPVLTFGQATESCLKTIEDHSKGCEGAKVASFAPGELMQLCFDHVEWLRLVPSQGRMYFYDVDNTRHDLDARLEPIAAHVISMPSKVGPIPPKCRISQMPRGLPPGPAILTGTLTSEDSFLGVTRIVSTEYPRMQLIVKAP
jgi:hypothetical protein